MDEKQSILNVISMCDAGAAVIVGTDYSLTSKIANLAARYRDH